jgi:hypothetical protein
VLLLAPVWMQMAHLLLADVVWIAFVLLGAQVLRARILAQSGTVTSLPLQRTHAAPGRS